VKEWEELLRRHLLENIHNIYVILEFNIGAEIKKTIKAIKTFESSFTWKERRRVDSKYFRDLVFYPGIDFFLRAIL